MKRACVPLAACCLVGALPATAQETRWATLGATAILRDAGGCTARTVLPSGIVQEIHLAADGTQSLRLSSSGWTHQEGAQYPVRLVRYASKFDRVGSKQIARGFRAGDRRGVRVLLGKSSTPSGWLQGPLGTVEVHGRKPSLAATVDLWGASTALGRCATELSRIDPGSGAPAVSGGEPLPPWPAAITDADYPVSALRAAEQGRTAVRVTISAKGLVSECDVTASSGSVALDSATCTVISRKLRTSPPLDANGKPTAKQISTAIHWRIPQ